jgi:hypothetical protein
LCLLRAELVDYEKTKPKPKATIYSLLRAMHLNKCLLQQKSKSTGSVNWKETYRCAGKNDGKNIWHGQTKPYFYSIYLCLLRARNR